MAHTNREPEMIHWARNAYGWTATAGGQRWTVRGPIFGKPVFQVFCDGGRVSEDGCWDHAVWFTTAQAAKQYVSRQVTGA